MERTLSMTRPRAERLDALLNELSWSVEDLAQFVAERRVERGTGGLHNVNGNAKADVKGTLQKVLLRQSRLPLGLCHEIASYFEKPPADLFVGVEEDEANEERELRAWMGNGASAPDPVPPPAAPAKVKQTRTKRAGGDPALIAARAATLQAAIDASGKSVLSIARELQPEAKKVTYQAILIGNWRTGKQLLPDDVIPALARFLNADEAALRAGVAAEVPPPVETASAPAASVPEKEPAPVPAVSSTLIASPRSPENALVEAAVAGPSLAHAAPPEGMMFIPVSRDGVLELLRKSTTVQVGRSGDNLVVGAQVVITPKNLLDLFG